MRIETRQCPECPAWMIRHHTIPTIALDGQSMTTWQSMWWCACGHVERADPIPSTSVAEWQHETWRTVNRQRVREEGEREALRRTWWQKLLGRR